MSDSMPIKPSSPYAASKVAFDAILIGSGRTEATLLVTSPMSSFVDVWEQQLAQTFASKLAL